MTETRKPSTGLFGRMFGRGAPAPEPADTPHAVHDTEADTREPSIDAQEDAAAIDEAAAGQSAFEESSPVAEPEVEAKAAADEPKGWFARLKSGLAKTSSKLGEGITGLFTKRKLDAETLDDLDATAADFRAAHGFRLRMRTRLRGRGRLAVGVKIDDARTPVHGHGLPQTARRASETMP